ncbi:glycosyltransferase family 1 protein [Nostoc sp. JL33]|uniref:glycosyltransferase family 1 protein n=1 Tax=Nostoc sp. JL33 TaxID=2815396 RepID=UPI0025E00C7B|nr:glycosyltransferase family 1 protein [Nostoc sp. JL33]MBN3870647.1 glycosyltransferase family 1 protein [Nostoc sp. JL33]
MVNYLTHITSIVPRLPPAIDGVGDYALNLARQLRKNFNIQTHFIVGNPTWTGAAEIDGFPVSQVSVGVAGCRHRSPDALLTLLSSDRSSSILLHYVGYGYAQRGCPIWLVDGLQRWKSLFPKRSLLTMFHEVYASGLPWTSSFWLSPLQKNLAARLAQMSDRCITSKQLYAEIIANISRGKHHQIPFLPVFSNIGEPDKVLPLSERQQRLVVFGGVANRARVYRESQAVLEYVCQRLNIQQIWDIGTPTGVNLSSITKVPILEIGQQSAEKVSKILADSVAAFSDYNPDFLAKSTIFASYCAHRLLPINTKGSASVVDGIEPGKHYWVPNPQGNELGNHMEMQAIADNAYSWYKTHRLSITVKTFAELLNN